MTSLSAALIGHDIVIRRRIPGRVAVVTPGTVLAADLDAHVPNITLSCPNEEFAVVILLGESDQLSIPRAALADPSDSGN